MYFKKKRMNEPCPELVCRFIAVDVSVSACNLRCSYCYVRRQGNNTGVIRPLERPAGEIGKAFSRERLEGRAFLYLYANGEPLLLPGLSDIVRSLLEEGHYVAIVTNMTVQKGISALLELPDELRERLLFFASLHYLELKRTERLSDFFRHIRMAGKAGCSWQMRLCLCPEYVEELEEIKRMCLRETGQLPIVSYLRESVYMPDAVQRLLDEAARSFDSALYDFQKAVCDIPRREFCHAGEWSLAVNLASGDVRACLCEAVRENIYFDEAAPPIAWAPVGRRCRASWCMCGAHFLSWGVAPSLKCPSYAQMFSRPGDQSFNELTLEVMRHKLEEVHRTPGQERLKI